MILIAFTFLIAIFLAFIISCIRPKDYPPGPLFIPFFGTTYTLPAVGAEFWTNKWTNKYGPIIGHKLGSAYFVFITSYEDIVEAIRHPNFQGRIHSEVFRQRSFHEEMGFFFSSDERWSEVRRFSLRYFSKVFTSRLEEFMEAEMSEFISTMKSDQIVDINGSFMKIPLNIILKVLCGCTRNEYRPEIDRIQEITEIHFIKNRPNGIELVYSFLKSLFGNSYAVASIGHTQKFLQKRLAEHKNKFNERTINDYMDAFLLEQQKEKKLHGVAKNYGDEELLSCAFDLIQAGNESTGKTIEFVLLYVALNPRIQDKIHAELNRVVGRNRCPKLDDKVNLPYMEAVILETFRSNPIAPLGVMHRVTEETKFRGFRFPKDTLISFAHKHWMNDPNLWNEPDKFIPERFIADCSLKRKLTVFGQGKRSCIGEILARNTIFLYLTRFFQNYSIRLPSECEKPSTMPQLGLTNGPKPFQLIITERAQV